MGRLLFFISTTIAAVTLFLISFSITHPSFCHLNSAQKYSTLSTP